MRAELLHILQHSLGCDQYGQPEHHGRDEGDGCFGYYRNRYVCDPEPNLTELVSLGLMSDHGSRPMIGTMHHYSVTEKGLDVMLSLSPKPPKVSKSKARYRRYLSIPECFGNFRQFLAYEKTERDAKRCGFSDVRSYRQWLSTL